MSKTQVNLVFLLGLFMSVSECLEISTIFTVCKVHDPNLNECLRGAIEDAMHKLADGVEELNTPALDPMVIAEVIIPAGTGTVHVEQRYTNLTFYNLFRGVQIKSCNATVRPDGFEIDVDIFSKDLRLEGDYKMTGKVLVLPINGEGKCVIHLENIDTKVHWVGDVVKIDGKVFGNLKSMDIEFLPKKMKFQFDNLFNRDPALVKEINNLLNEKWEDVFHDVKGGYAKFLIEKTMTYANEIFHHVEFNSLFGG